MERNLIDCRLSDSLGHALDAVLVKVRCLSERLLLGLVSLTDFVAEGPDLELRFLDLLCQLEGLVGQLSLFLAQKVELGAAHGKERTELPNLLHVLGLKIFELLGVF